jgi:hypothetical protein
MDRRYHPDRALHALPLLVLMAAAGCSGVPEQQLLDRYFQAARLRDNTTLGNIAIAQLSPEQGVVQRFEIVSVTEEQRRPLRVKDLAKAHDEARAAAEELGKKQKAYQDENIEAIARVLQAERTNATLRGRDAEVQAAWSKWRQDTAEHAKRVSAARAELADERMAAELSVTNPNAPVDLTQVDADLVTKEATIDATVQMPDQQTQQKRLVVVIQRAEVKAAGGATTPGRWVISEVREAPAS